jgi:GNAT superfamily N-acetyltransferase
MSAPGVTLQVLDARQAAAGDKARDNAGEQDRIALHEEVAGDDDTDFARRLAVWRRQPGFVLAEARHGGYLVGYACGLPLRPSTDWWRDVTAPLPATITDERPGRTFALTQLLVRGSWRRQGIATELLDLVLADRAEERATVKLPTAAAAQAVFRSWGWTKVARTRAPGTSGTSGTSASSAPVYDILTRPL